MPSQEERDNGPDPHLAKFLGVKPSSDPELVSKREAAERELAQLKSMYEHDKARATRSLDGKPWPPTTRVNEIMVKHTSDWPDQNPWTIRLWINLPDLMQYGPLLQSVQSDCRILDGALAECVNPVSAAELLVERLKVRGVNAVEVLDPSGCGVLIYPDWP